MLVEKRNSEVHLRPRFSIAIEENSEKLLQRITNYLKKHDCIYKNKIVDGHVFLDIPENKSHFWSPQLHLEVIKESDNSSTLKGLFGPKPQVWTLFMFVHFIIGITFLAFCVLLFTRISLGESVFFPLVMVVALPLVWILLYFLGQVGKETGKKQMKELHDFMLLIIKN